MGVALPLCLSPSLPPFPPSWPRVLPGAPWRPSQSGSLRPVWSSCPASLASMTQRVAPRG